jgi:hypothetical protein
MGHRQDMTPEQRLKWDCDNYKKRLEANKGSNYEYWTDKHDKMLENGWEQFNFKSKCGYIDFSTTYEDDAKEKVIELRSQGNYARIVCVTNRIRIKTYHIIFKTKKSQLK